MSVIVKGMKMPKDCYDCPLHDGETGRCNILGITICDYIPKECPLVEFRTAIDEMPNIEPKQKKGRWIVTGTFDDFLKCSCCGYKKPWNEDTFNFCPHCGVPMVEAKMEICDDVSDFQPTRKDVEKAFDILVDKSKEKEK